MVAPFRKGTLGLVGWLVGAGVVVGVGGPVVGVVAGGELRTWCTLDPSGLAGDLTRSLTPVTRNSTSEYIAPSRSHICVRRFYSSPPSLLIDVVGVFDGEG